MTHNNYHNLPHFDLANHPPSDTINMITGLLERITKTNDKLQASNSSNSTAAAADKQYTAFHSRSVPTIGIHAYLARILKYCPCTNECFLSLLVYFDRMSRNSSCLRIDSYNIHRLVISGIMVASKFFSDIFFTNTRYAKVGGLPVAELNALELEFLHLNDYNLNVPIEELQQYGDQLLSHWVREEERRRELHQWRRKEVLGRSLSTSSNSDSSTRVVPSSSSSPITPTTATTQLSTSSHSLCTLVTDEASKSHQYHHRRQSSSSHLKEGGTGSDPLFCRQSRASKLAHENRTTRAATNRYSTTSSSTEYHQFAPSQSLDGIPTSATKQMPHHHQRHSWHIDHHHRLPTPPYSTVIHP
ncbi:cyclin-domain-containing protein [Phascolomyces articulosus]|uniref:Cyclin-domain-containing protein n=1 Tax=Phascolomyces articulosus TaxID=60185 RepID=A0AAD5KPF9_9FUNG|nr:cyclin-domain-containing protein [Phascolomyces articulosus]